MCGDVGNDSRPGIKLLEWSEDVMLQNDGDRDFVMFGRGFIGPGSLPFRSLKRQ